MSHAQLGLSEVFPLSTLRFFSALRPTCPKAKDENQYNKTQQNIWMLMSQSWKIAFRPPLSGFGELSMSNLMAMRGPMSGMPSIKPKLNESPLTNLGSAARTIGYLEIANLRSTYW
jgi:hypothetical protein